MTKFNGYLLTDEENEILIRALKKARAKKELSHAVFDLISQIGAEDTKSILKEIMKTFF